MRSRVRRPPPEVPDPPELCAAPGCSCVVATGLPACAAHFREVPALERFVYFDTLEKALSSSDVQATRRAAKIRIGMVLRGVRA